MTYSTLITHVRDDDAGRTRLGVALDLAARFKAKVVGVGAESFPVMAVAGEGALLMAGSAYAVVDAVRQDFEAARRMFKQAAPAAEAEDWREYEGRPAEVVSREARGADLVIASARTSGVDFDAPASDLIMLSGRPVLVLPDGAETPSGRSVLVAWKDAREARRAIADAMPFLMAADHVAVVEIADEEGREAAAARVQDVCRSLARHGVAAHAHARPRRSGGTTETLLAVADEHEADLLVTGGYGHSRVAEWVFGGVTRRLLGADGRTVLMSH